MLTDETATMGTENDPFGIEQRILDLLSERHGIGPEELERAIRLAAESGSSPWTMASRLGLVAESDLASLLASALGLEVVEEEERPDGPLFEGAISPRFLRESRVLPLFLEEDRLHLAMADPTDTYVQEAVEVATGHPVTPRVAPASWIESLVEALYGEGRGAVKEITDGLAEEAHPNEDAEMLKDLASEAPVIRLVNLLIQQALESHASDIHLEPQEERLRVRYRVDGVLIEAESLPANTTAAVISRIKLMARLDIAERRLPQDGRFSMRLQGKRLDMRVSTVPTLFGESLVIRLLDKHGLQLRLDSLGFQGDALHHLHALLELPHGILLVTGPTGSGKSTTLYAALALLNDDERKIITVEDPVEYRLEGINQIQVKPQIDLTFARALRAIVRQDPDIIMVGEMRDLETARIATQSALTGHLVLSTLHTNDAASGITRLRDMGIEPYLITSTVNGIVAQRLVRRLCPHCARPEESVSELAEEWDLDPAQAEGRLLRAVGCDACNGIGYRGRTALTEVLVMNDSLRRLVLHEADADDIRHAAMADGMISLREDGKAKALEGITTLGEVARVTLA